MLKPMKQQRKQLRLLYQNIPEGSYCSNCQYKHWSRNIIYCKLNKRASYNDLCMSEGVKWCGRNWGK